MFFGFLLIASQLYSRKRFSANFVNKRSISNSSKNTNHWNSSRCEDYMNLYIWISRVFKQSFSYRLYRFLRTEILNRRRLQTTRRRGDAIGIAKRWSISRDDLFLSHSRVSSSLFSASLLKSRMRWTQRPKDLPVGTIDGSHLSAVPVDIQQVKV